MRTFAAGVALVLLTAGCTGGGSADDRAPAAQDTRSPVETPSETLPLETPSDPPSATPTTTPLTGPVLEVQGVSVRLPEGYEVGFETPVAATAQGKLGVVVLGALAGQRWSLDRLMQEEVRSSRRTTPLRAVQRLPDTTLDGLPAYHFRARPDDFTVRDVYGTWDSGYQVLIRFELSDHRPEAKRRELIESVVATYDSPTD